MNRRIPKIAAALTVAVAALASAPLHADQTFNLTIASSHPTTLPWVGIMSTHFVPEVTKRVAALNKGYKINWREAYGGQLYKMNATLTSVEQGVADIGWVFGSVEAAKLPLLQVGANAPFGTDDLRIILDLMNELNETVPALKAEWDKNNLVYLGASGVDTYHLWTKFPVASIADLKGRKISAPGVVGTWLRGTGATPVDGSLTTYYTDIQTGVSEGTISIATGILPTKIYEVAPYVTKVDIGALYNGAMAMNKDTFAKLPADVQKIVKDVGKEYSKLLGEEVMKRYANSLKTMVEVGAKQNPPVQIAELAAADRTNWIKTMPNIAGDWIKVNEARKLPARQVLKAYMDGLRKRGVTPAREWDQGN